MAGLLDLSFWMSIGGSARGAAGARELELGSERWAAGVGMRSPTGRALLPGAWGAFCVIVELEACRPAAGARGGSAMRMEDPALALSLCSYS